ncbi:MAG: GntR family transcriptional regulator [Bacteroidales bacterium]|nr:GntR family transcriptional regulator [Bacteroidales bacterium]
MTTFNPDRAIFLQMADRLCDEIISGTYAEGDRVPSVRDYAVSLQVNTNTAVKTYEFLSRDGIIYNKRGVGYYVSDGAKQKIMNERKEDFFNNALPEFFRQMKLLNISIDEVCEQYKARTEKTN